MISWLPLFRSRCFTYLINCTIRVDSIVIQDAATIIFSSLAHTCYGSHREANATPSLFVSDGMISRQPRLLLTPLSRIAHDSCDNNTLLYEPLKQCHIHNFTFA
jgi:hypothetical protein